VFACSHTEQYISAAAQLKETKANAARQKEIARAEKEERQKRKEAEREDERQAKEIRAAEVAEARLQKAAQREEARAAKEAGAAEAAHAWAVKAAEKETLKAQRAERAIRAAEARAQREGAKARRATAAHNRRGDGARAASPNPTCRRFIAVWRLRPHPQSAATAGSASRKTSPIRRIRHPCDIYTALPARPPPPHHPCYQFDRCQPCHNTNTWQMKEDTL